MSYEKSRLLAMTRKQLSIDMNCRPDDFLANGVFLYPARENDGRRLFDRQKPYLEAATMGKAVILSVDEDLIEKARPLVMDKTRDEIFSLPFIYGHSLYYLPDPERVGKLPAPRGFQYILKEGRSIHELYAVKGFNNAIQYDENHPRPDVLVVYALAEDGIAGMAGASADSSLLWQIGIDVLVPYREKGLAAYLVSLLADEILKRGKVPYYGTASSNIASQATAYRSGFFPAWMCSYKNLFT